MSNPLFSVRALYPYESDVDGDLTFDAHQIITVDVIEDDEWYSGSFTDSGTGQCKSGIFPRNFVETIKVEKTPVKDQEEEEEDEEQDEEDSAGVTPAKALSEAESPAAVVVPKPVPAPAPMPAQAPAPAPAPIKSPPSHSISPPALPQTMQPASNQPISPELVSSPPKKRNAFQDRIAAFNISNAAPSPFAQPKPSTYSKKPFHAVPTNSYVPQMPFAPKQAKAPVPTPPPAEVVHADDSDGKEKEAMPKMSLKERIKLLQQQQEAEAARSEALAVKKRQKAKQKAVVDEEGDLTSPAAPVDSIDSHASLEAMITGESLTGVSRDLEENDEVTFSREAAASPESHPQQPTLDPRPKIVQQAPPSEQDEDEDEDEEESEDEEDEEEARRLALRERMAKISGGMGMPMGMGMGMMLPGGFGASAPSKPSKKKKAIEEVATPAPVPVPVMVPVLPFANPAALSPPKPTKDNEDEEGEEDDANVEDEAVISKTLEQVSLDKPEIDDTFVSKEISSVSSKVQAEHVEPVKKQAGPVPEAEVSHTTPSRTASPTKAELSPPLVPPVHRSPLTEPEALAANPPAPSEANRGLGSIIAANIEDSDSEDSDDAWSEKGSSRKTEPLNDNVRPPPPAVPAHAPVAVLVSAPIGTQDHQERTFRM